ncbi:MAG: glyoxylate/hydroxypyruvate reductase A [Betaproteobacteria bacterium]|nr:glyoxylate/hydroxypyruvate reductase A [Betaproteobacteria bacterium]
MDILFFADEPNASVWLEALQKELPQARVRAWVRGETFPCDYAICWKPPPEFFVGQARLKAIFNLGAGVDSILHAPGVPMDVTMIRVDDAGMAAQMEEYVAWCALHFCRRFDEYGREQALGRWTKFPPRARSTFPVGVMGLGVLGGRVAAYLAGMGFPVSGWSRTPKAIANVKCFAGDSELPAFLGGISMLVCMLPLTDGTRGILNRAHLSRLPAGAYVVNVARGEHLVEADLLQLLDGGHLAGAALDVFAPEPLPVESPLWRHPRVIVTPHISARTLMEESMRQIAGKLRALERGEAVAGVVDRACGY